jgi:hypothetical protein
MRDGLLGRKLTDNSYIGPGPDLLDHRFGVIAASLTEYAHASASAGSELSDFSANLRAPIHVWRPGLPGGAVPGAKQAAA